MTATTPQTGYAPVNGLELYYEIHGSGAPLILHPWRLRRDRDVRRFAADPHRQPSGDRG